MTTLQIIPVITSREMVQLTAEQRVFVVLNYTRTQSTTQVRNALREQPAFVTRAVRDMHRRTMLCVAREGGHVEGHGA